MAPTAAGRSFTGSGMPPSSGRAAWREARPEGGRSRRSGGDASRQGDAIDDAPANAHLRLEEAASIAWTTPTGTFPKRGAEFLFDMIERSSGSSA